MPVAPQSTGSAISLTGNPGFKILLSESVAIDPLQGAHLSGPGALGPSRSCLLGPRHCPHVEHLDSVAGAAGENELYHLKDHSAESGHSCFNHIGGDHFEEHSQTCY